MQKPSTESLDQLPSPTTLKGFCKAIAALEAIVCPEWEHRHYSFQKNWGPSEELFEMRKGQGDQMLILFGPEGVCINGFAHESAMNGWKNVVVERKQSVLEKLMGKKKNETKTVQEIPRGVVEKVPEIFKEFIFDEPVKSIGTTFCIWATEGGDWSIGSVTLPSDTYKDGSSEMLQLLDGNPSSYKRWAEEYYESEYDLTSLEKVYSGVTLTKEIALQINPQLEDLEKLKLDLEEIGYRHEIE